MGVTSLRLIHNFQKLRVTTAKIQREH